MAYPLRKSNNAPIVLVIEDDALARVLAVSAFDDAGFIVMEGDNAAQALAILGENGDYINAVFTDVDMPGEMDGLQLALHAHERWPDVGFVVASGKPDLSAADMPCGTRFFSKPYDTERVIDHIRGIALATA